MAGISLELRRLYREGKLGRVLLAVGYSAVLGTGNWLFAILSIFISAYIAEKLWGASETLIKYQIYIKYCFSLSLIISGFSSFPLQGIYPTGSLKRSLKGFSQTPTGWQY
jgi:uncharacterized membrane protein